MLGLALMLLATTCDGGASECSVELEAPPKPKPLNVINLRAGSSTGNSEGKMVVCMEGTPLRWLALEACGTGANLWTRGGGYELSHYRVEGIPFRKDLGPGRLRAQAGLGFAELQVAEDEVGFTFNEARGGVETAGFEGALSGQYIFEFWSGVDLVFDTTFGLARFPNAPQLITPRPQNTAFLDFSLGLGW